MKKLFAILAIAGTLAACNNGGEEKPTAGDSSKMTTPATEATKVADSASKMMNNMADSAKGMMNKATDSAGKMMNKMTDKMKEGVKH